MTTSRRTADTHSIRRIIEQQIACADKLLATLDQERQALLGNSMPALEQASADKLAAATTLQSLNADLLRLNAGPQQIESLLRDTDPADSMRDSWRALLDLAARCQKAHLGNGALLDERQSQLRRNLRSLPSSASNPLYGRSGDAGFNPESRRLASA